jgi:glyoxylase-like metal-dependent hydrolase (beta-lactamase superfamily II)
MKVHQFEVGNMENFTYLLEDEETGEAIILDPSWNLDEIQKEIVRRDLKIKYIVNTHHHFDHTLGNEAMAKETKAKILQHESSTLKHDISLINGQKIKFGNSELIVFHTPGHSKDSICLVGDGKVFTGDTLFVGNCGRVDLPGGNARELYHSLFDILGKMDENFVIYPGHNYGSTRISTLGKEKQNNFVLQKRSEQEFVELMEQ